jgi:hypothetical protein
MMSIEIEISNINGLFVNKRVRETVTDQASYFMRMLVMAAIIAEHTGDWTMVKNIQNQLKDMNRELTLF